MIEHCDDCSPEFTECWNDGSKCRKRPSSFAAPTGSALWAVMKAHTWGSISAHGFPLQCPPEGPHRFIPVFNTREQAVAWDGSDEHVAKVMMSEKGQT